jgi:hypothetical protein
VDAADVVAIVTVAATVMTVGVSLFSLQVARTAERTAANADRHEHMPVLVCPSKGGGRIAVHNVGTGPALNIAIARGNDVLADRDALSVSRQEMTETAWSDHQHLQPMEAGEKRRYQWVDHAIAALTYTDALGQPYTTLLSKNGTQVFKDMAIPRPSFADMDYAKRLPNVEAGA